MMLIHESREFEQWVERSSNYVILAVFLKELCHAISLHFRMLNLRLQIVSIMLRGDGGPQ